MYEIRSAGVKGLGVFANQLIPRGTRIFSERPLLSIKHGGDGAGAGAVLRGLTALTVVQRQTLLRLSGGAPRHDVMLLRWGQVAWYHTLEAVVDFRSRFNTLDSRPKAQSHNKKDQDKALRSSLKITDSMRILSVFRSNAFDIGLDRQAVFPIISRINHSCVPGAEGNFDNLQGTLNVHATRDISGGEEIMINYLKETGVALREQRQAKLLDNYGFDCICLACDTESQRGIQGEQRRVDMLAKLANYAKTLSLTDAPAQGTEAELAMMVAMMKLFESEGLKGRALSAYYLEASKLCVKLERRDEAILYAEKAMSIQADCLGKDHELYMASLNFIRSLRG